MNGDGQKRDPVSHAINHAMRQQIIEALWHGVEPLSVQRFHREYVDGGQVTLSMVGYHFRQLELDGITKPDGEAEDAYVLAGPNSDEAIRRLKLLLAQREKGTNP